MHCGINSLPRTFYQIRSECIGYIAAYIVAEIHTPVLRCLLLTRSLKCFVPFDMQHCRLHSA